MMKHLEEQMKILKYPNKTGIELYKVIYGGK